MLFVWSWIGLSHNGLRPAQKLSRNSIKTTTNSFCNRLHVRACMWDTWPQPQSSTLPVVQTPMQNESTFCWHEQNICFFLFSFCGCGQFCMGIRASRFFPFPCNERAYRSDRMFAAHSSFLLTVSPQRVLLTLVLTRDALQLRFNVSCAEHVAQWVLMLILINSPQTFLDCCAKPGARV